MKNLKKAKDFILGLTIGNPRFQIFGKYYYRIPTAERAVALTFDDGPVEPFTRNLLGILDKLEVKATFFFKGENIEKYPDLTRLAHEKGHQLGNHSYSHPHMIFKSGAFIRGEIEKTDALLRKSGYDKKIYFRAPYAQKGVILPFVLWRMKRENILFDFFSSPRDWVEPESSKVSEDIIQRAKPGSILLLHDGNKDAGPYVAQRAEEVILGLRKQGFAFKTVDDLLEIEN